MEIMKLGAVRDEDRIVCVLDRQGIVVEVLKEWEREMVAGADHDAVNVCQDLAVLQGDATWSSLAFGG